MAKKIKLEPQASLPKELKAGMARIEAIKPIDRCFTTKDGLHIVYSPGMYARPWKSEYRVGMIGCLPTNELVIPPEDVDVFKVWLGIN